MEIDITSPNGNIYAILGIFEKLKKELEKTGTDVSKYDELLNNYKDMTYNEILDEIEKITNGSTSFIGRD